MDIENKTWPFIEAKKILKKINNQTPKKGYVLFETGFGPSGLPHIGTFGEVARTTMVINAFKHLSDIPTKLFAFSDDMDGLRKIPSNIPNQELLNNYIDMPLIMVPDPFEETNSFADYNNNKLKEFLNKFNFNYEFKSASECYRSGVFNDSIKKVLENYNSIMKVMLPTLREERQKNYSPILPISQETGKILYVNILKTDPENGTITYKLENGEEITQSALNGMAKLQWKADWAMRWDAFDVDYEMCGSDLIDSYKLSSNIVKILGGKEPANLIYSLFTDVDGQKISKSKGNGFSMEEWLKYGNPESLSLFMYNKPNTSKKLFFDQVPKNIDEYLLHLKNSYKQNDDEKTTNPVWHIHNGNIPTNSDIPISYSLLLNLVSAANISTSEELINYIKHYNSEISEAQINVIDNLSKYIFNYYTDHILPYKEYKKPENSEIEILNCLKDGLYMLSLDEDKNDNKIQTFFYDIGKKYYGEDNLKNYFSMLYEVLLGQKNGPRMGSFTNIYGIDKTINLINDAINNNLIILNNIQKIKE